MGSLVVVKEGFPENTKPELTRQEGKETVLERESRSHAEIQSCKEAKFSIPETKRGREQ